MASSPPSSSSSSSSSSNTSEPTPNTNNLSASESASFDRWRRKAAWVTGYGLSPEDTARRSQIKNLEGLERDWNKCQKWKTDLMRNSPAVVFMLKHINAVLQHQNQQGTDATNSNPDLKAITPAHIHCAPCERKVAGGFSPDNGILLCQDGFMDKKHMEDTLVHELVHVYDHVKFKVDWNNLRHHACSEIRAANLSGDCRFGRELSRGFMRVTNQHQHCVRRRAVLSVTANPVCPNKEAAEQVVNEVWSSCFKDTRPFDEIY